MRPDVTPSIAAAIRPVLERAPAELAAIRERARRAVDQRYNWDSQVETLFDVYTGVLSQES